MPLGDVCIHTAVQRWEEADGPRVEGERDKEEKTGVPFDCFLMLPGAAEENTPRGRRKVTRPTLLCEPWDRRGGDLVLKAEDDLDVTAEELTGRDPVRWQVDGKPTPLAAPGDLIGFELHLKRVED